jgi:hypothetical protein
MTASVDIAVRKGHVFLTTRVKGEQKERVLPDELVRRSGLLLRLASDIYQGATHLSTTANGLKLWETYSAEKDNQLSQQQICDILKVRCQFVNLIGAFETH